MKKRLTNTIAPVIAALSLAGFMQAAQAQDASDTDDASSPEHTIDAPMQAKLMDDMTHIPNIQAADKIHRVLVVFNLALEKSTNPDHDVAKRQIRSALSADDLRKFSAYNYVAEGLSLAETGKTEDAMELLAMEVEINELLAKAFTDCHCVNIDDLKAAITKVEADEHITVDPDAVKALKDMGAANFTAFFAPQ